MTAKDVRYFIIESDCRHETTNTTRGRWKARVTIRASNKRESVVGIGEGSSARVAYREAINDAFGYLARHRI